MLLGSVPERSGKVFGLGSIWRFMGGLLSGLILGLGGGASARKRMIVKVQVFWFERFPWSGLGFGGGFLVYYILADLDF